MADVVKVGEVLRRVRPDLFAGYSPREIGRALRDARPDVFGKLEDVKGPSRELIGRGLPKPQTGSATIASPVLPPSTPSGLPTAEQIDQATRAEAQQFVQGVKLGARMGVTQQAPPVPRPRVTLQESTAGKLVDVAGAAKDIGRSLFTPAGIAESFASGERQLSRGMRELARGPRQIGVRLPDADPTGERIGPPAPMMSDSRAKAATDILQGAGGMSSVVAAPGIVGGGAVTLAKGGAKGLAKFGATVGAGFAADPVVRGVTERGAKAMGASDDQAELAGEIASFGVEPAAVLGGVKAFARKKKAPAPAPPPKAEPRVRTAPDIEAQRADFQERVKQAREDITPARTKEERRAKLAKGMGQAEPIPSDPLPANLEPIAKEMGLDPEKVTREERGVLAEMFREREAAAQAEAERPRREFEAKQEAADRRKRNEDARQFGAQVEERKRQKRVESARSAAPGDAVSFGEDIGEVVRVNQRTLTVRDAAGNERRVPFEAIEEVAKPKAKLGEQMAKGGVELKGAEPAQPGIRPAVGKPAPADAGAPRLGFDKPLEGPAPVAPVRQTDGAGAKPAAAAAPPEPTLFDRPAAGPVRDNGGRGLDARTPGSERQPVRQAPPQAQQQASAPASVPAQAAPAQGRGSRAKTRSYTVDTGLELIEGDNLIASSTDDLSPNSVYDQELQPRSTNAANTDQRIGNILAPNGDPAKFDPERLGDSLEAQVGAPIIGRMDNMVESGNARVLALRRAYRRNSENAKRYRQYLIDNAERFGLDPEAIRKAKAPILVRRRVTDFTREQRLEFVREANEDLVNQMSAADSARLDSERLTPQLLGKLVADKDYTGAENSEFVREFLESIPPNERGRLIDNGRLTGEGISRIENAVLAKAYGDTATVRSIINESGEDFRNLSKAMQEAAPRMAALQNKVAAGERFDVGIAEELADAAATMDRLRRQGMTVDQFVNDQGRLGISVAPSEPTLNDRVLLALDAHKRAPKRIAGILERYADLVDKAGDPRQGSMFGQAEPPNRSELWNTARRDEEVAWVKNQMAAADKKITAAIERTGATSEAALLAKHPDPLKPSERSRLARLQALLNDLESGKSIDEATRRFEDGQQSDNNPLLAGEEGQARESAAGNGPVSAPEAARGAGRQDAPAAVETVSQRYDRSRAAYDAIREKLERGEAVTIQVDGKPVQLSRPSQIQFRSTGDIQVLTGTSPKISPDGPDFAAIEKQAKAIAQDLEQTRIREAAAAKQAKAAPPVETYQPPDDVQAAMRAKGHKAPRATVEHRADAPQLGKPSKPPKYLLTVDGVTRKSFDTFDEAAAAADATNHRIYRTGAETVSTEIGQATIRRSAEGVEVQIGMMRQKLEAGDVPAGASPDQIALIARRKHAGKMVGGFFGDPERGAVQITRRGQERAAVLTPGQPNVRPTLGQNLKERAGDVADALRAAGQKVDTQAARTQLIDRTAPIQDFLKAARSKGISADQDAGILARTFAGVFGAAENKLDFLDEILKPVRADYQDLVELAMFDRFAELARRGVDKFPDGMTRLEVLARQRDLHQRLGANPERYKRLKDTLQNVRSYQGRILSQLRDEGIISDYSYQQIRASNQAYIPLQRVGFLAEDVARGVTPRRFSVATQDVVKELTGSSRDIIDPLESIVRNTYKTEHIIRRNRVARAMADLAGHPDYKGLVIPLKRHQDAPSGMEKLAYFEGGKVKHFAVPKTVGEAMKGLGQHQADLITKAASIGSGALRAGATGLNVAFIPSNALRDFQTLGVTQGTGLLETSATWLHGLAEVAGKGRYYREWKDAGGAFSGFFESLKGPQRTAAHLRRGKVERAIRTAANPFELIRHASEIIEQAPRVGAYKRARAKLGQSATAAAFTSRNATVDFARSGSALAVVNQWIPFLNARLQGNLNIFKSFRDHPARTLLASGSLIIAPTLATYFWNKSQFPEVEKDIQPWERETYFHLILGDEQDSSGRYTQVIKIPKGEVGRVMGNSLEAFLDYVAGRDGIGWQQLGLQILSDVSPVSFERDGQLSITRVLSDVLPPTAKAFTELAFNRSFFTGRDIVPRNLADASPAEQYKNDTPAAAVAVGQALDISPLKIQAFVRSQFGGLGEQVMNLASGSESGAARTVSRRFFGASGGYGEEQAFRTLDQMKAQTEDMRVRAERDALRILDAAKAKPLAERLGYLKSELGAVYQSDPAHAARVWEELEYEAVKDQLTPFERALKASPVSVRAEMIAQQARELPPQQRGEYVRRLEAARILTGSVLEAIAQQAQAQAQPQRAGVAP